MIWLYLFVGLLTIVGAIVLNRASTSEAIKVRISAWFLLVVGMAYVLLFAIERENQMFVLSIGLMCWVAGIVAFVKISREGTDAHLQP